MMSISPWEGALLVFTTCGMMLPNDPSLQKSAYPMLLAIRQFSFTKISYQSSERQWMGLVLLLMLYMIMVNQIPLFFIKKIEFKCRYGNHRSTSSVIINCIQPLQTNTFNIWTSTWWIHWLSKVWMDRDVCCWFLRCVRLEVFLSPLQFFGRALVQGFHTFPLLVVLFFCSFFLNIFFITDRKTVTK